MDIRNKLIYIVLASGICLASCSKKTVSTSVTAPVKPGTTSAVMATQPCIIYKTRKDYSKNVPVGLSEDKSRITSYPDVSDILRQGASVYPTPLADGFLLDNRGIGPDVGFLSITYEEYSANDETPSAASLFRLLLDKNPLKEMYQCGSRDQYVDVAADVNKIILSGNLTGCTRLR